MEPSAEERIASSEQRVHELVEAGSPLRQALEELVRTVESLSSTDVVASILLLDETGTRLLHGAAPSLPPEYCDAIDGLVIGPTVGSCGTAAYSGHIIMVYDIATDPLWADFKDLALAHDLRACWSMPIRSVRGTILGTFALYHRVPTAPSVTEREIVTRLARTAAEILERYATDGSGSVA